MKNIKILNYDFRHICDIEPHHENGQIFQYNPSSQYRNSESHKLNEHGDKMFCKFEIPRNIETSGVYVITVNKQFCYLGRSVNLSRCFNAGFGQISPSSCFTHGNVTHCRINHEILTSLRNNEKVSLFFHQTFSPNQIKSHILQTGQFPWVNS